MAYVPVAGSMEFFIAQLAVLEATVATEATTRDLPLLRVYPLRRTSQEFPAIYNWITTSAGDWKDATGHRHRTTLNMSTRVSVGRIDSDELSFRLVRYADVIRDVMLPAFRAGQPLGGAAKWVDIPSLSLVREEFGEAQFPAIELTVQAWLDVNFTPTPTP